MELLKYLFLGFIQGMTETIPVSSSGHLLIFQRLINSQASFKSIAIITNFGSLIAIVILFWKDIVRIVKGFFKYLFGNDNESKGECKYAFMIILGCIPAGIAGLIISYFDLLDTIKENVMVLKT